MDGDRTFSQVTHLDQWARCSHESTALLPAGGVTLTWTADDPKPGTARSQPVGLAFDRWCRAYRSRPDQGRVEVIGGGHGPGLLRRPLGLAVDRAQRLYIAENGAAVVHVVDLRGQRLLRKVPIRRPVDVTARCCGVLVLAHDPMRLVLVEGRRGPRPGPELVRPPCSDGLVPCRVTGEEVLWRHPRAARALVSTTDGRPVVVVPGATDIERTADGTLVVARRPGWSFRRFDRTGVELPPLGASGYDGGAIATAPDGRIAFTTAEGIGHTSGPVARYAPRGRVVTYRLDSGAHRTRWGRLFLDACLPRGTDIGVQFLTSDEGDVADPLKWRPADRGQVVVLKPELTPPLPSQVRLSTLDSPTALYRGETPVAAAPGRYLWVVLTLTGTERIAPTIKALRVERPGHQLLRQLPQAWSRDDVDADFLQRFLGPAEGVLHELDSRADRRATLLDPSATPPEALSWLASFAGLTLDHRWPQDARRALVKEAYPLFRRRGTKDALARILCLYLRSQVSIMERWQLRGLGGTVLGPPTGPGAPEVGGATGSLGRFTVGGATPGQNSYTLSAHRFTVLVPGLLNPEQRDVVLSILEGHRPAHTVFEICELGRGMRVGQRLHLRLTSFVGPGARWEPAVVGQTLVGADGVVGVPAVGARLGHTSVTGRVRVG